MEIYDQTLTNLDFAEVLEKVTQPKWAYGHGSLRGSSGLPFWQMELTDDEFFSDYLLNIIRETVDEPHLELERVYANGHVYGDKAMPHTDGDYEDCRTFLLYANSNWDHLWGGKTAFLNEDNTWSYVEPAPNRGIFFPGMRKHHAEEVSRVFNSLRVTIAWKLNGATRKLYY
jgi:hypothetical protein